MCIYAPLPIDEADARLLFFNTRWRRIRMLHRLRMVVVVLVSLPVFAMAQMGEHVNFSAGGGFSVPTSRAGERVNTGWNVNFRGGVSITNQILADLDFTYVNHRLN